MLKKLQWHCPSLPPLEPRLQRRYQQLVQEHLQLSQTVAAGLNALPGLASSFASTQAAWRFYQNDTVSLPALVQPLVEAGRRSVAASCHEYALMVHDWSLLNYDRHASKTDRIGSKRNRAQGYELQTALLISDQEGQPLAPMIQNLACASGLHSTRTVEVTKVPTHLDELLARLDYLEGLSLSRPLIHIIDREGDSVGHYRQWQAHTFLVRAKGRQRVQWESQSWLLDSVAKQLREKNKLMDCRPVDFQGRPARQYVAETAVVLTRPTRQKRRGKKPSSQPAAPVPLRLIVSEVRADDGQVLSEWLLLSNAPAKVGAERLALWYYWRWRIESFFKLLKSAGQQAEHWQQESGSAVAKRLLIVSMACVLVWQLGRDQTPQAEELRRVLVRLSGRQMKRPRLWTAPALLEGLGTLFSMLHLLEHYDISELRNLSTTLFKK
jgi:IS4 transposase